MLTIYKALLTLCEDYVGEVEDSSLYKKKADRPGSMDLISIDGIMDGGKTFSITLSVEDHDDRNQS